LFFHNHSFVFQIIVNQYKTKVKDNTDQKFLILGIKPRQSKKEQQNKSISDKSILESPLLATASQAHRTHSIK